MFTFSPELYRPETGEAASEPARHPVVHSTTFEKNTATRLWRARCTCGWFTIGEETWVKGQAAAHDMWVPAVPA